MLTLLSFKADWCTPCQAMQPIMDTLKQELKGKIIFTDIDIDSNPQTRVDYQIRSIPAFVLIENQKEVARRIGSGSLNEIKDWINEYRA